MRATEDHKGVSPGGGSSNSCSLSPARLIATAPVSLRRASTRGTLAPPTMICSSCQDTRALFESEPLLEVVDIGSSGLESGVLKDFLMEWHVSSNTLHYELT